jgi:PPOX class probable F420-dependent enzyme
MDTDEAKTFLRDNHRAVLVTHRRDGGLQTSPISVGVDGNGKAIISSRETAYKVRNLRRQPWATLCVMNDGFYGRWLRVEGPAEILSLPDAMEPLVDYYRRLAGEHPDWDEYRTAMTTQKRVLIRIDIQQAGPDKSG